jgi:hypothetical protein
MRDSPTPLTVRLTGNSQQSTVTKTVFVVDFDVAWLLLATNDSERRFLERRLREVQP